MNNFNIRTKLYVISGIIFVAVVSLAFMIYTAMIKTQELDLSLTLIESARSGMLSLRRDEKDFLARNNIKYVEKFHNNKDKLFKQLARLQQLVTVYFPEQNQNLEKLSEHLTLYTSHFDQLAVIQQHIGLDQEKGLRGQLRAAVHKAEQQLKGLGLIQLTADMLMLRRNEKDFIIRQDMKYLDKYSKNFDVLLTNMDRSGVDSTAQELIHKNMQDYRNGFKALVTSAQQKGLDHNSGLLGEMRTVVHQTETIFDQLATELDLHIAQQQRATLYKMIILLGLFVLVIVGALLLQARNISKRLATFNNLDHIITDDKIDLTVKLEESGKDEITNICRKFNYFINDLKSLIGNLPEISQKLNHSAESNITTANETTRLALEQKSQTDQIAVAIGQMIETIGDINNNIHDAASSAEKAKNDAFIGKDKITKATTSMNKLSTNMQQSTGITTELEVNSSDISQVLDVIRSIAEQTNLLALNAAIEAARAGENGRGFAVVADEVRTLAQRTQDSTEEIRSLIEKLHNGVQNTVRITQDSNENAATGVSAMEEAIASFEQISQTVNQMYQLNTAIATASEQQTATSENILANIAQISNATDQTSKHADMVMQSGDQFVNISSELGLLVSHYRL